MSKIRKPLALVDQEARAAIEKEVLVNRTVQGLQQHDIAVSWGLSDGSASILMRNVDKMSPPRIRILVRMGLISPMLLLKWLGYSEKQIRDWISQETASKEGTA